MSPRSRQLARLLRALIACCALLFAVAPPSFAAAPRDSSSWIAERVATTLVTGAAARTAPTPTPARAPLPLRSEAAAPTARRASVDARYLYLDLRTLLC